MSIFTSPNSVTKNLVFYYDANSLKSYTGPAIQNRNTQIAIVGTGTATGFNASGGTETVFIPGLGNTSVNYVTVQNNYTSFTPNSTNCCPSYFQYGSYSVSPSTLYTYGIVYKCDSGYTHPNFMYRYEYNGGTYVTEAGVHSTANRTHLGDGWWWAWGTFTTQATTNTINSSALFYYQYSQSYDKISVAKVFTAQGDYTGLHPKYWPDVNVTRAGSTSFQDITQSTSLTPANLTYNNAGVTTFNGSTSYIDCGNPTSLQISTQITIEAMVYPTSISGLGNVFSKNANSGYRFRLDSAAGALWWYVSGNSVQGGTTSLNTWAHLTVTGNAQGLAAYINGVLVASNSTAYTPTAPAGGNAYIGAYAPSTETFAGRIDYVKVYDRALTATEISQNFASVRGRYSL